MCTRMTHLNSVSSQAKLKISRLEQSIQQAQMIERQMLEMSQWMGEMGQHLQSRLDADLLAGDVPQEHEVSVLCFFWGGGWGRGGGLEWGNTCSHNCMPICLPGNLPL